MRKVIIMLLCLFTMYSFKNDVITGKASYYGKNHHGIRVLRLRMYGRMLDILVLLLQLILIVEFMLLE